MTTQEMITVIRDNLGDRTSGRIGSRDVDTVILESINIGIPQLVQELQPDYYNRTATINIVSGTAVYDLPVVDDDGGNIRIKDIYSHKVFNSAGTPYVFKQLNYHKFVEATRGLTEDIEGTPLYFALWGRSNKLHLDYVPTEDYTMHLYVESYPIAISATQLGTALPIDDEWLLVLESFCTAHCYLKLQQSQSYAIWQDNYLKQRDSVARSVNEKQSHGLGIGEGRARITDPVNDPSQRSWN